MILSALLTPKTNQPPPKPGTIGDKDLPIVTVATPVPVIFGTCVMGQPNVVDWGGLYLTAVKKSSGGKK